MIGKAGKFKILVIDDEAYIRESVKSFLEDYGYEVFLAENGKAGLEFFEKLEPDLVLCDLRMPEMDGLDALSVIVSRAPEIPIIIVSGAGNITDTVEALRIGAWDYIIKPVQDMTVLLHAIKKAIERSTLIREKERYSTDLESLNAKLLNSIDSLEKTRNRLVQSEKMAALGGLVAGVAHEINTPVGIAITAASYIKDKTEKIGNQLKAGNLKKSDLEGYLRNIREVSVSILINMERAAELIKSFKQVSVDQTAEEKRLFNLKKSLQDTLLSLKPAYRNLNCDIKLDCDENIDIISYPGAYSQILSNLLMNSIVHGFKGRDTGKISIYVSQGENDITISYMDNGKGIGKDEIGRIFDPFFTTMRGKGGTGLGMSIVFNIVTQILGGTIDCSSNQGIQTEFLIVVPRYLPEASNLDNKMIYST